MPNEWMLNAGGEERTKVLIIFMVDLKKSSKDKYLWEDKTCISASIKLKLQVKSHNNFKFGSCVSNI